MVENKAKSLNALSHVAMALFFLQMENKQHSVIFMPEQRHFDLVKRHTDFRRYFEDDFTPRNKHNTPPTRPQHAHSTQIVLNISGILRYLVKGQEKNVIVRFDAIYIAGVVQQQAYPRVVYNDDVCLVLVLLMAGGLDCLLYGYWIQRRRATDQSSEEFVTDLSRLPSEKARCF